MPQSIGDLEQKRSAIVHQLTGLAIFAPVPSPPRLAAAASRTAAATALTSGRALESCRGRQGGT
jgi:hypothetical protein